MGFLIRVVENGDRIVEEVVADRAFNPVGSGMSSAEFPLLGRPDPYGDTFLDSARRKILETELQDAAHRWVEAGSPANSSAT